MLPPFLLLRFSLISRNLNTNKLNRFSCAKNVGDRTFLVLLDLSLLISQLLDYSRRLHNYELSRKLHDN